MSAILWVKKNGVKVRVGPGASAPAPPPVVASSALFSSADLAVWQQRAVNGPFKTAGDVATNTPGDWTRITNHANQFRNNPNQAIYNPQQANVYDASLASNSVAHVIRDAAFYALVANDQPLAALVKTQLVNQAAAIENNVHLMDARDVNLENLGHFVAAEVMHRWVLAEAYIQPFGLLSNANEATTRNTHTKYANTLQYGINKSWDQYFANRTTEPVTVKAGGRGYAANIVYDGGPPERTPMLHMNNRRGGMLSYCGSVGKFYDHQIATDIAVESAKLFVAFGTSPPSTGGFFVDFERAWQNGATDPSQGWKYSAVALGSFVWVAHLYPSLWSYSTSNGDLETLGGPKTMGGAAAMHAQQRTNARTNTVNGVRIAGSAMSEMLYAPIADLHTSGTNQTVLRTAYKRIGLPALSTNTNNGPVLNTMWVGPGAILPGTLFMYGYR